MSAEDAGFKKHGVRFTTVARCHRKQSFSEQNTSIGEVLLLS